MYGEVILANDRASEWMCLTLCWRDWLDPDALPLTDAQATERRAAVPVFLASHTRTAAGWREAYKARLEQVAVQVASPDLLNLALSLAVQHFQLTTAQQKARVDFIDACLAAEFGDVLHEGDAWEPLQRLIDKLRVRALLMPQALLEHTLREASLAVRAQILTTAGYYEDALPGAYARAYHWLENLESSQHNDLVPACSAAIWSRKAADRPGFVEQLDHLLLQGGMGIVRDAWAHVVKQNALDPQVLVGDFVANVVGEATAADHPGANLAPWLSAQWQFVQHSHAALIERGVRDALAAGQSPDGAPGNGPQSSLHPVLKQWADMERAPLSAPLNAPPPHAAAPPLTLSAVPSRGGDEDEEAYAAQCQIKTLGWLQGPIAAKGAPAVAVNELAQRELANDTAPAPALTLKARAKKQDQAKAQQAKVAAVQGAMKVALLETARFMADELDEGLAAAQSVGVASACVQQAAQCAKTLAALRSEAVTAVKFPALQQQLFDAEQAVAKLHAGIRDARQGQAEDRVVQRLLRCLCQALSEETLALGKRHGGVIAFEATPADWGWIARRLHRRCLLTVNRLIVKGRSVALGTEHAVGLYVTQSSRSGPQHVFDISVHLWSRRKGCTGSPCGTLLEPDPFPPFNEAEWFDTLAPCAVLHLPRKA